MKRKMRILIMIVVILAVAVIGGLLFVTGRNGENQASEKTVLIEASDSAQETDAASTEESRDIVYAEGWDPDETEDLSESEKEVASSALSDSTDVNINANTNAGGSTSGLSYETSAEMEQLKTTIESNYLEERMAYGQLWSVVCIDLAEADMFAVEGDRQMLSASVLKMFIMGAAYAEGRTDLYDLLVPMITVSDNDAANRVVESLGNGDFSAGMEIVNGFCQKQGYTGTSLGRRFLGDNLQGDNYTTANDCAKFLADIYNGTCVSSEASAEMIRLLQQQTRTGKIPAGLAGYGAETANKTGELSDASLGYVENDVAIVWGDAGTYVLCILGNQVNNTDAVSVIQQISLTVYQTIGTNG